MSDGTPLAPGHTMISGLEQDVRRHSGRGVMIAARIGYAAKALVYCTLGALSLLFVLGLGDGALTDSKGAIERLGSQPFGNLLLWATALGLACYALWCTARALLDPERHGKDLKGVFTRLGLGFSALTHGSLAVYAARAAFGGVRSRENGTESWARTAMTVPAGEFVLGAAGLIAIGFGTYQLYRAARDKPEGKLSRREMSAATERVARRIGRFGQTARGIVFPIIGVSLVIAALRSSPREASDMGEALAELLHAPFGRVMVVFVAAGLFAYGVYQAVLARYAALPERV